MLVNQQKFELADWIRRRLGAPILNLNFLHSTQIDDCIDESVLYFGEHAGGIGNEQNYCLIQTLPCEEMPNLWDNNQNTDMNLGNDCTWTVVPSANRIMRYRHEYQLPKSVMAIDVTVSNNYQTGGGMGIYDEDVLRYGTFQGAVPGMQGGGMAGTFGMGGIGGGLFIGNNVPGYGSFGAFGTRGDSTRSGGMGIDLVSYELGLQYLQMFKQRYTIKLSAQFLEQERKVRFSPPPQSDGLILLGVWTKVAEKWLYEHIWVKRYSLALSKIQIGYNVKKYDGMEFPGGVKINGDFYLEEGKAEVEKLEEELLKGKYSYPVDFFVG